MFWLASLFQSSETIVAREASFQPSVQCLEAVLERRNRNLCVALFNVHALFKYKHMLSKCPPKSYGNKNRAHLPLLLGGSRSGKWEVATYSPYNYRPLPINRRAWHSCALDCV